MYQFLTKSGQNNIHLEFVFRLETTSGTNPLTLHSSSHSIQVLRSLVMSWWVESSVGDERDIQNMQWGGYPRTALKSTDLNTTPNSVGGIGLFKQYNAVQVFHIMFATWTKNETFAVGILLNLLKMEWIVKTQYTYFFIF